MKAMLVHSKIIIKLYYFAFMNLIFFIIEAYVSTLHLIGICLDSKHCRYTYMNLFINIKILKSELSWCCRNRILPVQHIWRATQQNHKINILFHKISFHLDPLKRTGSMGHKILCWSLLPYKWVTFLLLAIFQTTSKILKFSEGDVSIW